MKVINPFLIPMIFAIIIFHSYIAMALHFIVDLYNAVSAWICTGIINII